MSVEYDRYLSEHIGGVQKGWEWMEANLLLKMSDWIKANYKADEFDPIDIFEMRELVKNHDASKTEPDEYYFYDDYFYLSKDNRSSEVVNNFHRAFLMHMHRNPHHWQYWVLTSDNAGEPERYIEMPLPYIFEMICDWWSFSWRSGDLTEIFKWWDEHKDHIRLHKKSRRTVEKILEEMKKAMGVTEEVKEAPAIIHADTEDTEENPKKFGVPEIKKYPMPDADHVRSAIRFFNYIDPKYEKELAEAILERAKEYGVDLDEMDIGDENRFKNYISDKDDHLEHHGIKGQKWGVRRFQNEDGTRTNKGKEREYYRRRVVRELKNIDDVNRIVSTLSEVEQKELGVSSGDDKWIPDEKRIDQASNIAKTFLEYDGDIPVSMLEIWDIGDGRADIALATDPKYRGTGTTSRNIQKAIFWFNSPENTRFNELQWNNLKENAKSGQIADHYGFGDYVDDDKWEYRRIFKKGTENEQSTQM